MGLWIYTGVLLGGFALAKISSVLRTRNRQESIMSEYREILGMPKVKLEAVRSAMVDQMEKGLEGAPGGLMMLPSFVDVLPNGTEQGEYYAIDLGGTNLRVMWVKLSAQPGIIDDEDIQEWPIPPECFDTDNSLLLDWVAECSLQVISRHSKLQDQHQQSNPSPTITIGFCFSFACKQTSINNGELLLWTKNFKGQGLLGKNVVAALIDAFTARGVAIEVPVLVNDTVATLVALCYTEPRAAAGIILGTGTNCAYLESISRFNSHVAPLPESYLPRGSHGLMVVNTEWGDLSIDPQILERCEEDLWVDCASTNPGHGLFEKLISGLYLGEIVRRIVLKLAEHADFFGSSISLPHRHHLFGSPLSQSDSFDSASLAAIDQDDSKDLSITARILESSFGVKRVPRRQLTMVQELCRLVSRRSALLCAAGIAAVVDRVSLATTAATTSTTNSAGGDSQSQCAGDLPSNTHMGCNPFVIAVDGSLFTKYPAYRAAVRCALESMLGKEAADRIRLEVVRDGSVAGAAYLAAAVAAGSP